MSRPQNGVNGSIPQQPFTFIPNSYNINNQVPRGQNQTVYGYSDGSQVLPNHYVPQGYTSSLSHNMGNNIRPVSPMVTSPQYAFYPFQFPQPSQFSQYPYGPNYIQNTQYMYPQETSVATPINNPPTARKFKPLKVFDPSNNTDLDLSKFQSAGNGDSKSKGLLDVSKFDKNNRPIDKEKEDTNTEEIKKEAYDELKEFRSKPILEESNVEEIKIKKTEQVKEFCVIDKNVNELYEDAPIVLETIIQQINFQSKEAMSNERSKESIYEAKANEGELEVELKEDIIKIESVMEKSDIEEQLNESEILILSSKSNSFNYYLPIDKKESDETILRRKKIYDREYLITIKSNSQSQKKPLNLPSTADFSEEIIYSKSQNISWKKPDASQSILNNNDKFPKKQALKFQPILNKKYKPFQPKLINLDLNENQVFTRLKSSYLPPQLRDKEKEIDPYLELKRIIKCNLNKITPQNFQDCLSEINKLNIKEKDEMACLISEIFIKAVQEEAYSVTYAQFCNKLALKLEIQSFKSQLLKKCQDMFQTPIQDQLDNVRKEWISKIDNETDAKLKILYESDLEEQVKKAKDRYFGNIRFIGELFLHNLLAGKVILNCIVELLKGNDSDALLALCKLMETCGKQIDERHTIRMDSFIYQMDELTKSKDLETRIRFKLKDIIDMRKRAWTLRHIQQEKKINPKTIEEQKEEATAEAALAANKLIASYTVIKRSHHNIPDNSVRRQPSLQQKQIPVKNLRCASHVVNDKTILGPERSNWTSGSGSKQKTRDSEAFHIMTTKYSRDIRSPEHSPQIKIKNKYHTLESSTEGSGADSRSSTPPIAEFKNIIKSHAIVQEVALLPISDDERADVIFNELMLTGVFDINNWTEIRDVKPIIAKWIDDMMEKDATCRREVADSFLKLIDNNIITYNQLIDGSKSFIACADDLICDIPKLWEFFSQFLERFIRDKFSNISFFHNIFIHLLPHKDVARCLSMTLHSASSRLGHNIVGQVFFRSSLKWNEIVPGDWETFVVQNNLKFTIDGGTPLSKAGGSSLQSISDEFEKMLLNNLSNEQIFEFCEKHIDKPTWKSKECTSTITCCILKALKNLSNQQVRIYFIDKSEIIKRFSQNKLYNEIEVLRSVSNIADELDIEILTTIYDVIMTRKIVSNDAFDFNLNDISFKSEPNFNLTFQIISELYVPKNNQ